MILTVFKCSIKLHRDNYSHCSEHGFSLAAICMWSYQITHVNFHHFKATAGDAWIHIRSVPTRLGQEKPLRGNFCYSSYMPTAKLSLNVGLGRPFRRPQDPAYHLFKTLATLFFYFDADQNTSSTWNLTGLLAMRRLLALTSCGLKKKGCWINFQFAKKWAVPIVQLFNLVDKFRFFFLFLPHRINN